MLQHGSGAVVHQGVSDSPSGVGEDLGNHGLSLRVKERWETTSFTEAGPLAAPPPSDTEPPATLRVRLFSGNVVNVPVCYDSGGFQTAATWKTATCEELTLGLTVALDDVELSVSDRVALKGAYFTYGTKVLEGPALVKDIGLVTESPITVRLRLPGGMQHAVPQEQPVTPRGTPAASAAAAPVPPIAAAAAAAADGETQQHKRARTPRRGDDAEPSLDQRYLELEDKC